jgi:hypothetical protein
MKAMRMNATDLGSAETVAIRSIGSFPEWLEASAKMRQLAERYNAAAGMLQAFKDGSPTKGHLACEQRLAAEAADLRGSVVRQKAFLDEIESRCTSEIARQAEPSYQSMMARIRDSALSLSEALDEESEFRRMLERQRIGTETMPGIPSRVRRTVRALRRLPSPVPGCLTAFVTHRRGAGGLQSSARRRTDRAHSKTFTPSNLREKDPR